MKYLSIGLLMMAGAPIWAGEPIPCSIENFPASRDPDATYFVAVALPDTVEAGPGDRRAYPEHFAEGLEPNEPLRKLPQAVFGQVFRPEEVKGAGAEELSRVLDRTQGEVVVVPWEYRADCKTTPWKKSARWVEPGARGLFIVREARPPELWTLGRPTFDVSGWRAPYPQAAFLESDFRYASEAEKPVLSPDELLSLYEVLPSGEEVERDPVRAYAGLREWRESHPEAADRFPATRIWEEARWHIERTSEPSEPTEGVES